MLVQFWGIKADIIAPKVLHSADLIIQILNACHSAHFICIFHKFQVKLVEISLNIYALARVIVVLIDQHEVWVNLKTAIFSENEADLVMISSCRINFGNGSIFE